jgi:hypothetical protein
MTAVVVLALALTALAVVSIGGALWIATRTLRRLRRLRRAAGRLVEDGTLRVKAYVLPPGRARQAAVLRRDLRAAIDRTGRLLDEAGRRDCPLGELPRLFRRVEELAASVDGELRTLEREPGPLPPDRVAAVRGRGEGLVAITAMIRSAVGGVHAELNGDLFRTLHSDVDLEVRALRAGVAAARRPGGEAVIQEAQA